MRAPWEREDWQALGLVFYWTAGLILTIAGIMEYGARLRELVGLGGP